ncbi:MAG: transcriptional regulator, DeoR family [Mycobacterium sp.]|nr:transcriptional regulator, DeoR family [Mycobacterium sp.]
MSYAHPDDGAPPRAQRRKSQRQAEITEVVFEKGQASAAELAERFGVSIMTVHRDLDALAAQGIVRRYHGGAAAQRSSIFEPDVTYRMRLSTSAKQQIASTAITHVAAGSGIMLDDSTSALALARLLPGVPDLTVATNFVDIIEELGATEELRLIGLGGEYSPTHRSFLGHGCIDAVRALRVNTLFASTSAMSVDGSFHQEPAIVAVKRAMMEVADRRILLMDHSKLGRKALHRVSDASDWDLVIVDAGTPDALVEDLAQAGANVVVARGQ